MPAVLDSGHEIPLRGGVAGELVRYQHARDTPLPLQELAKQVPGGPRVTPALDEHVEHDAVLVHGSPQPVCRAGNLEHDLVQMPFVAGLRQASTDLVRERLAELHRPLPYRFVAHDDTARPASP